MHAQQTCVPVLVHASRDAGVAMHSATPVGMCLCVYPCATFFARQTTKMTMKFEIMGIRIYDAASPDSAILMGARC